MDACLLIDTEILSDEENAALFWICSIQRKDLQNNEKFEFENDSSEFTRLLSPGKLTLPPNDLHRFVSICYKYLRVVKRIVLPGCPEFSLNYHIQTMISIRMYVKD